MVITALIKSNEIISTKRRGKTVIVDVVANRHLELNASTVPDAGTIFVVVTAVSNHCIFLASPHNLSAKFRNKERKWIERTGRKKSIPGSSRSHTSALPGST